MSAPTEWTDDDYAGTVTPAMVAESVEKLATFQHDNECAHGYEDTIHASVLEAIRDGRATNPAECARAALETKKLTFTRWYA